MKKVSIITPCYNGEKFVSRYLDTILNQTYGYLELIFVNDGSTDKTEEIVSTYRAKFEEAGIEFVYMYQENAGQAVALNQGLKIFTGDYLTWPDSDDILSVDSIEKKVRYLEEHKDVGLVRSAANEVSEHDLHDVIGHYASNKGKENIFLDLLLEKTYVLCGCYLVRTSAFLEVNPQRDIYHLTRAGQNWQMLLPITHKFNCGYMDEPLYTYVIRQDSHYHSITNLLQRCDDMEDIMIHTIHRLDTNEAEKQTYRNLSNIKFIRKRFRLAIQLKDLVLLEEQYKLLSNQQGIRYKDTLLFYLVKLNLYESLNNIFSRLRSWRIRIKL